VEVSGNMIVLGQWELISKNDPFSRLHQWVWWRSELVRAPEISCRCMDWITREATEIKLHPNMNWAGKFLSE